MHLRHMDSLLFQLHYYQSLLFPRIRTLLSFKLLDRMCCESEMRVFSCQFLFILFIQDLSINLWAHMFIQVCRFQLCHQEIFHNNPYQSANSQLSKQFEDQFNLDRDIPLHMIHILSLLFNFISQFPLLLQIF